MSALQVQLICICSDGSRYDGDWVKDKCQGHGELKYVDGTTYLVSDIA